MPFIRALPVARTVVIRPFSTSIRINKSLTDTVKETADAVNKKVGETLASGLGKAEEAAQSTAQTITEKTPGKLETHYVAEKAQQGVKSAGQKTANALDDAAAKAREAQGEVRKNLDGAQAGVNKSLEGKTQV